MILLIYNKKRKKTARIVTKKLLLRSSRLFRRSLQTPPPLTLLPLGLAIFIGWEGSAADGRVLREDIHIQNGLRVPRGKYYFCDVGNTNGEGFLAPYHGKRYHRSDWSRSAHRPSSVKELFNYNHYSARNIIESCFGAIKMQCTILRSPSFYPIRVHNPIINACCLLHNLIRREMPGDLILDEVDAFLDGQADDQDYIISQVEPSQQYTEWRDQIAQEIWNISHPS